MTFLLHYLKIPPTAMSNKNKTDHSLLIVFFFYIYTNLHVLLFAVKISEIWMFDVGFFVLILVTKLFTKRTLCNKLSKYKYCNSPRLLLHLKTNEAEC